MQPTTPTLCRKKASVTRESVGPGPWVGVPVWVNLSEGGGMVVCVPASAGEQNQPDIQPEPDQDFTCS